MHFLFSCETLHILYLSNYRLDFLSQIRLILFPFNTECAFGADVKKVVQILQQNLHNDKKIPTDSG